MIEPRQRQRLIALNVTPRLSRPALYRLAEDLSWIESPRSEEELALELGVPLQMLRRAWAGIARPETLATREEEEAARAGGRIVVRGEAGYPETLTALPLPPPVLSIRGTPPERPGVAIVGSRRPDRYGLEAAETFSFALAEAGLTIVSGFARGIDTAAHRAALKAQGGATLAVLGCGLAVDYPRGNRTLAAEIERRGALLSELPSGAPPLPWHFPLRNRTIAALAAGVLVVRAAARSGSLITARHALDLGKGVWAIPGSIFDDLSLGPNALLRDGAAPALHPRDLLDELLPRRASGAATDASLARNTREGEREETSDTPREQDLPAGLAGRLLSATPRSGSISAEELALRVEEPVDRVLSALLDLEIDGLIRKLPGFGYAR